MVITDFDAAFKKHGDKPEAVQWESQELQEKRFDVLTTIFDGEMDTVSVLDAGCGLGHFNGWLRNKKPDLQFRYYGIDVTKGFVDTCKSHGLNVWNQKIEHIDLNFDYIVMSGAYNVEGDLLKGIDAMWENAGRAIAFNFLDSRYRGIAGKTLQYFDVTQVSEHCMKFKDLWKMKIRDGSLTHGIKYDTTVFLWKNR